MRHAAVAPTSHPAHGPSPVTPWSRACHTGILDPCPSPVALNSSCSPLHGPSSDLHMEILCERHSVHIPQGPLTPGPLRAGTLAQNQNIKAGAPETYDSQTSIRRKQLPNGCGVRSQSGLPWGSGSERGRHAAPGSVAHPALCTPVGYTPLPPGNRTGKGGWPRGWPSWALGGEPSTLLGSPSQGGTSEMELTATLRRTARCKDECIASTRHAATSRTCHTRVESEERQDQLHRTRAP